MDFSDEVKKTLTEILAKYAAGNAEIVRAYFSRPRSREQDIAWLKCQAARELTTAWKFLDNLKELQPKFEKELKRKDYESLARAFSEELEHYRLFVTILEEEFGERIDVDELLTLGVWSDNERSRKIQKKLAMRRSYALQGMRWLRSPLASARVAGPDGLSDCAGLPEASWSSGWRMPQKRSPTMKCFMGRFTSPLPPDASKRRSNSKERKPS
jgi:hypothetical protein